MFGVHVVYCAYVNITTVIRKSRHFLTNPCPLLCSEFPDEEGSGVDTGSGMISVTTVTQSPEVFFRTTTTESEAIGEVETQRPTEVDFTFTEGPTELPLPQPPNVTETLTEQIQPVTARPDVGREPSKRFKLPPTGK